MTDGMASLRGRQRAQTQRLIQEHAIRLFLERGYEQTTVSAVAAAAGVSPMTLYRHFPTKEDLVLRDEYDPLIAQCIAARPATEPLIRRIGNALIEELERAIGTGLPDNDANAVAGRSDTTGGKELLLARLQLVLSTPALRARRWDSQYATQKVIVEALRGDPPDPDLEFRLTVATGACLAAASAALFRWVEQEGRPDLTQLMTEALAVLFDEQLR
jgi:AcrR family transcriptional regulator